MSDVGECRTCKAPVVWTLTAQGGKSPIDAEPVADGNVLVLRQPGFGLLSVVLSKDGLEQARRGGVKLRRNHWSTCPDAAEWRAAQAAKAAARAAAHDGSERGERVMEDRAIAEAAMKEAAWRLERAIESVHEAVACPACGAPVGERCVRRGAPVQWWGYGSPELRALAERENELERERVRRPGPLKHPHSERLRAAGISLR